MDVIIAYKGALAFYSVICEKPGLYSAYLKEYRAEAPPPEIITLTRSLRHWTGSIDDETLLNEIGSSIDRQLKNDPVFSRRRNDQNFLDNLV